VRLTVLAIVAGLVAGYARGGRFRHIGEHRVRQPWLLGAGLVLQAISLRLDPRFGVGLLILSLAVLLGFAARNFHLGGAELLVAGLALNALVISLNWGMPVRRQALVAAGATGDQIAKVSGTKHRLERPSDRLLLLADTVGIRPIREVESAGDLAVDAGVVAVLVHLMRDPSRPSPRAKNHRPRRGRR